MESFLFSINSQSAAIFSVSFISVVNIYRQLSECKPWSDFNDEFIAIGNS